jgi:farnesyl diphosphate synthase
VETSARLFGDGPGSVKAASLAATALECVHCYSLVHDDLPAMDDDDLRRGQPTVHIAFDEATAILAGDTLLTLAFEFAAMIEPAPMARDMARALSRASGAHGMIGGQMLDLEAEGRFAGGHPQHHDTDAIRTLQAMKTGALIRTACTMGAMAGQATNAQTAALEAYGTHLGYAFQIADDLLDHKGDSAALGKAAGKDAAAGKATLVGLMGVDAAQATLTETVSAACAELGQFGAAAGPLVDLAHFVATRDA